MGVERIEATSEGLPERFSLRVGDARAEVVPSAGMAMVSLAVGGREHLAMPAPLAEFMASAHTGGIPLLYPWANRLRSETYDFNGTNVDLSTIAEIKRDGNGLPMHGLLLRYDGWTINEVEDGVGISGSIEWDAHEELMRAFPFPHRLTVRWTLQDDGGVVTATSRMRVESKGSEVPVAAGWHPYLAPPVANRADLRIEGPLLQPIELDAKGLPVLDAEGRCTRGAPQSLDGPLADRIYDDLFRAPEGGFAFTIHGDASRMSITAGDAWHAIQVYAKAGESFTCIEPMVAPTAGLSDQEIHEVAEPGTPVEATFRVEVRR